jgi:hypothetical protein
LLACVGSLTRQTLGPLPLAEAEQQSRRLRRLSPILLGVGRGLSALIADVQGVGMTSRASRGVEVEFEMKVGDPPEPMSPAPIANCQVLT